MSRSEITNILQENRLSSGRAELTYADGVSVAVHEFVHLALDQIAPELPDWVEEGKAVTLAPHEVYDGACQERLVGVALPSLEQMRAVRRCAGG